MATKEEQFEDMKVQRVAFQAGMVKPRTANDTLTKSLVMQGGKSEHSGRSGLIDVKELARMETLENDRQWAGWITRFKDAIMARGHPAARCALDGMEQMSEKEAGASNAA